MNLFKLLVLVGLVSVGTVYHGMCQEAKLLSCKDTKDDHQLPPELQSVRLTFSLDDAPIVKAFSEFQKALWAAYPGARLKVAYSDYLAKTFIKNALKKEQTGMSIQFKNTPVRDALCQICCLYNITWRILGDILILSPYTEE